MSEDDNKDDSTTNDNKQQQEQEPAESLTVQVDKTTLDLIRERMEGRYNEFWGDVIDDEQKRTIEIADKLTPGQPYTINGKQYTYQNIGMRKWRELTALKTKADQEKDSTKATDMLTDYYILSLRSFFGMTDDEADLTPPGEARMVCDAAAYKVLHPIPLHPERLKVGSMPTQT